MTKEDFATASALMATISAYTEEVQRLKNSQATIVTVNTCGTVFTKISTTASQSSEHGDLAAGRMLIDTLIEIRQDRITTAEALLAAL